MLNFLMYEEVNEENPADPVIGIIPVCGMP